MSNKPFYILLLAFLCITPAAAQIKISGGLLRTTSGTAEAKVTDANTEEPIEYASVYLVPKADTLITNFGLTNADGIARFDKILRGTYTLHVEMLGYGHYEEQIYHSGEGEADWTIRLTPETESLSASIITASGNPMDIHGDTVVFNASSYLVGKNAMLKDLIRRMPGMTVTKTGLSYNGSSISRITIGGKTFFFEDISTALNNLPAKIVDKVSVIDREKEGSAFTGIAGEKETVMDLSLYEEYKRGSFGMLQASGGTTIHKEDIFGLATKALYDASAMISSFSEQNQLTVLANSSNGGLAKNDDASIGDQSGINARHTAGINYTTQAASGYETALSTKWTKNTKDERTRQRTESTLQEIPQIETLAEKSDIGQQDLDLNFETKNKDTEKYILYFSPKIIWSRSRAATEKAAETRDTLTSLINDNDYLGTSQGDVLAFTSEITAGLKGIGKERRTLIASCLFDANAGKYQNKQYTSLYVPGKQQVVNDILYESTTYDWNAGITIAYVEPLSKRLSLSVSATASITSSQENNEAWIRPDDKTVRNVNAENQEYTTLDESLTYYSRLFNAETGGNVLLQYESKKITVQSGIQATVSHNKYTSLTKGIKTVSGDGKWTNYWTPYLNLFARLPSGRITASIEGNSIPLNEEYLLNTPEIINATNIRIGNIYLKPAFKRKASFAIRTNNKSRQSNLNFRSSASLTTNGTVRASWTDRDGIRYSVPVNTVHPAYTVSIGTGGGLPLTKDSKLRLEAYLDAYIYRTIAYQSINPQIQIDIQNFDYKEFMDAFWGKNGIRFYNGESGFTESLMNEYSLFPALKLRWRDTILDINLFANADYRNLRCSLNESLNKQYMKGNYGIDITVELPSNWEMSCKATRYWYKGYENGYNTPMTSLDASITKEAGPVTIGLYGKDLLNSIQCRTHSNGVNQTIDTMTNTLGRHFFISIRWNFGKLNTASAAAAQAAAISLSL